MRWLIHGNLTPAVTAALVRHGHAADTANAAEADRADDVEALLGLAHRTQRDLLTDDRTVIQRLLDAPAKFDRSVVYLQLDGGDVEQDDAVDRLFARYKRLKAGMLYTVTETRVKVRQLPGGLTSHNLSIGRE